MQGRGLGTCLVGLMEKESLRKKRDKIRLRVFTDNPAKKLYVKLGFKVFIDEEDSVVLEKKV
jgi:ribosomal protein S18 acetylase RimI-like enzyme